MAASLPLEIWQEIAGLLVADDTRKLCLTCKGLMGMLQHKAYEALRFIESDMSGRSALALASGPRRELVRHVTYAPYDPRPVDDEYHNGSIMLSPEARAMLQSLHLFPNLESFKLDLHEWDLGEYDYSALKSPKDEEDEPWRQLVNGSLLALCSSAGFFDSLSIVGLPPISATPDYPALQTDGWRALLQTVTSLDFRLAEYPGEGACNTTSAHQDSLKALDRNLLSHLPNVRHLRLAGGYDAFIGGFHYGEREPIPFGSLDMPQLRVLELEWARVEGKVREFIEKHLEQLEGIYFRDCFANSGEDWERLFDTIVEGDPRNLVSFKVRPAEPEDEDVEPGRFIGLEVHDKYGFLQSDLRYEEDEITELVLEEESKAKETLSRVMALVARNRGEAAAL